MKAERVAVFVCVLTVLGAALGPSAAGGNSRALVTWSPKDVPVSERKTLFKGDQKGLYEPHIAIDPMDPRNVLAFAIDLSSQNVDPSTYSATRAYRSTDGGRTWADKGPVRYTRKGNDVTYGGDPVVVFAKDGTAYYASLATPPNPPRGQRQVWPIYVHRSRNGGTTWEKPKIAVPVIDDEAKDICPTNDKEWLSVDPHTGDLLLTYTVFTHACSGPAEFVDLTDIGIYLTVSDDAGKTWTKGRKIWDGYALSAIAKAGRDGTLYVSFWGTVELPPNVCPGPVWALAARGGGRVFTAVVVGSSDDRGKTWSYHYEPVCDWVAGDVTKPGRFNGGSTNPAIDVDERSGTVYVTYPSLEPTQGERFTIKLLSSSDGGATWSGPIEATPGSGDARMPALAVEDGILHLVYVETTGLTDYDNSSEEGTSRTFYTNSCDGGGTWSEPVALSTKVGQPTFYTQMGDYIGLDVEGGRIAAIWTDARDGSDFGEIWARTGSIDTSAAARCTAAAGAPQQIAALPLMDPAGGVMPFFAAPHRTLEPPSSVEATCHGRFDRAALRQAFTNERATSQEMPCDVTAALAHTTALAERFGYTVAFAENEGHEADALVARRNTILLVKAVASSASSGGTRISIDRV